MLWTRRYQLFLFDLDGLLVNTEELHFRAYRDMLIARGYRLDWDFATYFKIASQDAGAPKRAIYAQFPQLEQAEPCWDVLYEEKKEAYRKILESEPAPLLPGAKELLEHLALENIQRCVVTHTARSLVDVIRRQNPVLNTIPHWFCREDYTLPKPSPDGYIKAIKSLGPKEGNNVNIIGFEDSSRGLKALMQTSATPVLVNSMDEDLWQTSKEQGVYAFKTLQELITLGLDSSL